MEELYYLKVGNLIEDGFKKTMRIESHNEASIKIVEHSDFPITTSPTELEYAKLIEFLDSGKLKIVNCAYENERDKSLLKSEINEIKKSIKIKQGEEKISTLENSNKELKDSLDALS